MHCEGQLVVSRWSTGRIAEVNPTQLEATPTSHGAATPTSYEAQPPATTRQTERRANRKHDTAMALHATAGDNSTGDGWRRLYRRRLATTLQTTASDDSTGDESTGDGSTGDEVIRRWLHRRRDYPTLFLPLTGCLLHLAAHHTTAVYTGPQITWS